MKKELLQEMDKFWEVICFIGRDGQSLLDVEAYLKSIHLSESTSRRYINAIKQNKVVAIKVKDETAYLNHEEIQMLCDEMRMILGKGKESLGPCVTKENLNQVRTTSKVKQSEIEELKRQLKDQEAIVKENEALKHQVEQLQMIHAGEKIGRPILILSSQEVLPCEDAWEHQFVGSRGKVQEIPPSSEENVLTKENYLKRAIRRVFSDSFITEKVNRLLRKHEKEEFVTDKVYVSNLLKFKNLTNQEKLGLYAAFSSYRHTDFEQLLNFAGDNNINADLMIEWSESLGDEIDFLQLKNALRQFAKPSEYLIKYEFARELLLGKWYVEFTVNDKPTKFMLVSEDDIKQVREVLHLSEDTFTYQILEPLKEESEPDFSDVVVEKPDFVHSGVE